MQDVILASANKGKIIELQQAILSYKLNINLISQDSKNIPSCAEPFDTFIENALEKARHASKLSNLPAIADDSGLCIPYLNNYPGIYSSYWANMNNFIPNNQLISNTINTTQDEFNNLYLQHQLDYVIPHDKRQAYYYCLLVYVKNSNDISPLIAQGICHGELIINPRGNKGFGYDPHFYIPSLDKTAAELESAQKNSISHRGQAISNLMQLLINRN